MRVLIAIVWWNGCATADISTSLDVEPVPSSEEPPTVEPQAFDCYSETLVDDLLRPGPVNQRKIRGWDDRRPEPLRVYEIADLDGDTRWDREEAWQYNDAGLRVRYERRLDRPVTESWTYDERGNVVTYEEDEASDGTIDHVRISTWSDDDLELIRTIDDDNDGVVDFRRELEVSGDGRRHTERHIRDGELTEIRETVFDEQGRNASFTIDRDPADEALDLRVTYDWDLEEPVWFRTTTDDGANGSPDVIETRFVDASGALVLVEAARPDGEVYRYQEWTNDEEGHILRSFWTNLEIDKESESMYRYDVQGRVVLYDRREVRDGEVGVADVSTTTYRGTCP